jgi:hypothetical protein
MRHDWNDRRSPKNLRAYQWCREKRMLPQRQPSPTHCSLRYFLPRTRSLRLLPSSSPKGRSKFSCRGSPSYWLVVDVRKDHYTAKCFATLTIKTVAMIRNETPPITDRRRALRERWVVVVMGLFLGGHNGRHRPPITLRRAERSVPYRGLVAGT